MISSTHLADQLVAAMSAAVWSVEGSEAALRRVLPDISPRRLRRLAVDVHAACPGPYSPPPPDLFAAIRNARDFRTILNRVRDRHSPLPAVLAQPYAEPSPPFRDLGLPRLGTPGDLADWLGVTTRELDWFADVDGRLARPVREGLRHYTNRWIGKSTGGMRLIEAPKPRLKHLQRQILDGILNLVPAHPASFGFVRGRNPQQGAQRHAGEEIVACFDLEHFFVSVPASRIHAIFRTLGYPWAVARILTGLCTATTPREMLSALPSDERHRELPGRALAGPHLPQGAPTSPAIANLAARHLDQRLDALARRIGATYTRYADDMTFSGDRDIAFDRALPLLEAVGEIVTDEQFSLNHSKTRVQRRGGRQMVTGIVVNQHLNIRRTEYEKLKAILHNCRRFGPQSQNRHGHPDFRAHLDGRIAWVETLNLRRGERLRAAFDAIEWAEHA